MTEKQAIYLYPGGLFIDDRGSLSAINEMDFAAVKRLYALENFDTKTVRAFHGHFKEGKYVFVVSGSVLLCSVPFNDPVAPSKSAKVTRVVLSDRKPQVAFVPPGHANGFRALQEGTRTIFFSTSTLEESKGDDYRFPYDYWGADVWEVENR